MALMVLIVLGATLGWLASVVTRTETPRDVLQQIGVGVISTTIVGLLVNSGTFIGGLSLLALGAAIAAGAIALVAYHALARNRITA